jgi:mersacidin/lichenicidin family type 2 lantibiotic
LFKLVLCPIEGIVLEASPEKGENECSNSVIRYKKYRINPVNEPRFNKENMMSNVDVVRAWKDPEYRRNLSKAELQLLPEHPAGLIELSPSECSDVSGGCARDFTWTISCC